MTKRIATNSTPIDRVAARVVSKGFKYTPAKKFQEVLSETPLQMRLITKLERKTESFVDLTGCRVGRLTAIGISATNSSKWVCRCDCGNYTLRSPKAIKNVGNKQSRCAICQHMLFLKRDEYIRRTGHEKDINEFD